jgi:nitroreductase
MKQRMKRVLRILLPEGVLRCLRNAKSAFVLRRQYAWDARRFRSYSAMTKTDTAHLKAQITYYYHVIEKGLSFSNTRTGFGQDRVKALLDLMAAYRNGGGCMEDSQYLSAMEVLRAYEEYHRKECTEAAGETLCTLLDQIAGMLSNPAHFPACQSGSVAGGYRVLEREEFQAKGRGDFAELSQSRCSVRDFSSEPVDLAAIEDVIDLARKTPSVCNRQASRAYVVENRKTIQEILELHGGTRGFTEDVDKLIVIAGTLSVFLNAAERNQVYLDTGLFAMSILYGLHYKGLGACPLHWCAKEAKDKALRELVPVVDSDTVTCLVGVGHLPDTFKVAVSHRKPLGEILLPCSDGAIDSKGER